MPDQRPAVSARGVLDGDPAALANLCDLRGPAVVAYCEAVCGPHEAVEAAADTFGAFRATAVAATRPLALDPDALLLSKARHAAAERAPDPAGGTPRPDDPLCPGVPRLLAGAADRSLSPPDLHHLRRHLARCVPCRAAQSAQHAAERAYLHPPVRALDPITRQAIIAALRHAAPVAGAAAPAPPAAAAPAPARPERARAVAAMRPSPADPHATAAHPPPPPLPAAADPAARVSAASPPPPATRRAASPVPERHPTEHPPRSAVAQTGVIPVDQIAAALGYGGTPPEDLEPYPEPAAARRRLAPRLPSARIAAPAAVLLVALLIVLGIAGVFSSGSRPASGSAAPAATTPGLDPAAAHRARVLAANARRAARRQAAAASGGAAATGPTARALPAPAAVAPPDNGAAPATSGGYHAD